MTGTQKIKEIWEERFKDRPLISGRDRFERKEFYDSKFKEIAKQGLNFNKFSYTFFTPTTGAP